MKHEWEIIFEDGVVLIRKHWDLYTLVNDLNSELYPVDEITSIKKIKKEKQK